ncbi:FAD/NAD(P)-binding domain-containing protein [Coniophora puteana RWD-64-598 SS2]|uniref:FAD/NAD(P)-binding domain-containing protein n=1 Tax=Coniophora puteana (strain RWD-64-598) TaxID=741705 RepID=A0A5M3MFQ4_CONPW|nr:FAD/NAD(P)-binding domain-containing protein [Coniophora puteana RWD-64-598 SS2]EIW77421.1 FAD/NAD(P)-binding domain-containing protein [Coniophora puteana RWD-64-598 SS2]
MAISNILAAPVGVIGAGAAGLITAHTLVQDGFQNVQVLTRDEHAGGVWARERMYPGLVINSVHGDFRYSPLPMPPSVMPGKRMTGEELQAYMEQFAESFLKDNIRYGTEVRKIRRDEVTGLWFVDVLNKKRGTHETLIYSRLVVCTGGCSNPSIPETLTVESARKAGFRGLVMHSSEFAQHAENLVNMSQHSGNDFNVVVAGSGKSAQDVCVFLASRGIPVTMVFENADAVVALPWALPDWVRKSRLTSIMSPYMDLNTKLEHFLHSTWLGSKIIHGVWHAFKAVSYRTLKIPSDSPLRRSPQIYWTLRAQEEAIYREDGFYAYVNAGKIKLAAPARVMGYGDDGESIVLSDGRKLRADAAVYATGFRSSWTNLFDERTEKSLGLIRQRYDPPETDEWASFSGLRSPPEQQSEVAGAPIYRGIVPARNIAQRDFAINGAIFSANNGYTFEVTSHWISSYFLGDPMRLPSSTEEALAETARSAAWMRKRYPGMLDKFSESYTSVIVAWSWPQAMDNLLDDMGLRTQRSGGNWLTWPFKVVSVDELKGLKLERKTIREST